MLLTLLGFDVNIDKALIYPKERPISAQALRYEGETAYTIYHKGCTSWTKGEFLYLKQYAFYFLSAPCYAPEKMAPYLKSIERVEKTINFSHIVLRLIMEQRIDIF